MKRAIRLLVVVVAAAALLLELVLQIGHAIVAWRYGRSLPQAADGGRLTVLGVGDSFTFGVGARSERGSYPAALERILDRELGGGVRVVNAGWPGQNSYEVASQLGAQIGIAAPDYVLVLAGNNDTWHHADRRGTGWRSRLNT